MASLNAYDVMDLVHIHASVRTTSEDRSEAISTELHCTTTIQGTGEDDARQWLLDALVGMIEAL